MCDYHWLVFYVYFVIKSWLVVTRTTRWNMQSGLGPGLGLGGGGGPVLVWS